MNINQKELKFNIYFKEKGENIDTLLLEALKYFIIEKQNKGLTKC